MPVPTHNEAAERRIQENVHRQSIELHPDDQSESSTGSSEDLSSNCEREVHLRDTLEKSTSKLRAISVSGKKNQLFNKCQIVIQGGDKEIRSCKGSMKAINSVRRRNVSTQTSYRSLTDPNAQIKNEDPNTVCKSETEIVDSTPSSLERRLERIEKKCSEVSEECKAIKPLVTSMEEENKHLKRENESLKEKEAQENTQEPSENQREQRFDNGEEAALEIEGYTNFWDMLAYLPKCLFEILCAVCRRVLGLFRA